jgi:Zn-dependent protease with chaperone function
VARPVPYPPSPAWIPADLTELGDDATRDARSVVTALVLFLGLYLCLVLASLGGGVIGLVLAFRHFGMCVGLPIALVSLCIAFLLIHVLFYRPGTEKLLGIEITDKEQPVLFAFLRKLTREIGAPEPDRVFVTPEVNAAVASNVTLINLIVPPKRDLHIGLGLVNMLTLSEFKAIMGHEFGHFVQHTGRVHAYTHVAFSVMEMLQGGEGWVTREMKAIGRRAQSDGEVIVAGFFSIVVGVPVWVVAKLGGMLFGIFRVSSLALSRSHEFHADRVAVSVAGSNAVVHGLLRSNFADESLSETIRALDSATQHKLYSQDLYYHHAKTAERLLKQQKKPQFRVPPALKTPAEGQHVQVFDPDDDDGGPPLMWRTHPRDYDREENAKKIFVPVEDDDRSPWILFDNADELRERVTYKFYRALWRVKKSVRLAPPEKVQDFLDEEHAEVTYHPRYRGAYDERPIWPGQVYELKQVLEGEPWDLGRIARTHARLYREIGQRADDLRDLQKKIRKVYEKAYGRPEGAAARRLKELEEDLEDLVDWFKSFDRRVFLCHGHMATQLGDTVLKELCDRYSFHLDVQVLHRDLARAMDRVSDGIAGLNAQADRELPSDFFHWVRDSYQAGRKMMISCLRRARDMRAPEMASIKAGTRFDTLIFDQEVLDEPPLTYITGKWVDKLVRQLFRMRQRLNRMDFKSLGALLQMQDRIADEWMAKAAPSAILVDDESAVAEGPPKA